MTRLLLFFVVALLVGLLLVPVGAQALPNAAVGYKLYHYEGTEWVRYSQGDPFPPGGADPGTNLWKYEYGVMNYGFPNDIYQLWMFFNSDFTERSQYVSAVGPETWAIRYYGPVPPNYNWKVRFRTADPAYYVAQGDTLCGYEVEFYWIDPAMLPDPQNYDVLSSDGSEPGVTHELPPQVTPVEAATWGKIKSLFLE